MGALEQGNAGLQSSGKADGQCVYRVIHRAECLNENWFLSLDDAKEKVAAWRNLYNVERPHSALGNLAPEEFAALPGQACLAG